MDADTSSAGRASRHLDKEAALREVMAKIAAAHGDRGVVRTGVAPPVPTRPGTPDAPASPDSPDSRTAATPGGAKDPAAGQDRAADQDRDADPYAVARAIVLRQLEMSPKSRQQLRAKLRQRNCPDEVAEAVLDRLSEVGLVDDEKFAEAYVRSKQVTRGLSKRALEHELRTKGVDRDITAGVLAQVRPIDEEARARELVEARMPRVRGLAREVAMRRLAGMLARKGYPAGLSLRIIREVIDDDPAFQRD